MKKNKVPQTIALAEGGEYQVPEGAQCSGVAYSGGEFSQPWSDVPCYMDLAGMTVAQQVPIMYNHNYDPMFRLGETEITNDGRQLTFAGELDKSSHLAQRLIEQGRRYRWQVSMGAENKSYHVVHEGTTCEINGRTVAGPALVIDQSLLREISIVSLGADAETEMQIQAALLAPVAEVDEENEEEPSVDKAGIDTNNNQGEVKMNEELTKQLEAITAGLENLTKRIDATEKKNDVQAGRPAPNINVKTDDGASRAEVLQAALEQSMGVKQTDCKAAEVADKQYHGQLGLRQLWTECARNAGWDGYLTASNMGEAVGAIKAGFSTINLPGILGNAINKRIKEGWDYAEDAWKSIAEVVSVNDYKSFTTYSLNSTGDYEEVVNGGTITARGGLSETGYANQLKRYGMMFSVDEMDIINDDLGAINAKAFGLGRKAALKLNEVLWALFLDDADFFKTENKNLLTANGELNMTNLAKLNKAFKAQTDAEGKILGLQPSILLVPTALEVTASKLYNDTEMRDTTTAKAYTTGNPWQHKFTPVSSAYLTSDDDYYLLADPKVAATLQVAFLNGQSAPIVESNPMDFDSFGVNFRGKFSFGVAHADAKAGVKAVKGA